MFKALVLILIAGWVYGDTGFNLPAVIVSSDSTKAVKRGVQQLIFSTGTVVNFSGSVAKISLLGGSTQYIQDTLSPTSATQIFSVQTGSATTSFTSPTYIFSNKASSLQDTSGSPIFGYQGSFNVYLGQDTTTSTGGGFNSCTGYSCMNPFNGGTFSVCNGAFCMNSSGFAGEQCGCSGYACMASMTSGKYNNCNGGSCMGTMTTAQNNVCNGINCLYNTNADFNSCDGQACLQFNTTGTRNWGVGARSGIQIFDVSNSTNQVAQNDMGYLGYATGPGNDTGIARSMVLGNYGMVSSSDTLAIRASNIAIVQSTAPAVTSCGTNPSLIGNNSAFTVTVGGTATGCTVGFSQTFANSPTCVISERTASVVNALSYTVSTSGVTFSQTGLSNAVIDVLCVGSK